MVVSRYLKQNKKITDEQTDIRNKELRLNPIVNGLFEFILKIDELFIRCGVQLPFGGSLMVVAAKE